MKHHYPFRCIVTTALALSALFAMPVAGLASSPTLFAIADDALDAAKADARDLLNNRTAEGDAPGCYPADARTAFARAIEAATTTEEITEATKTYLAAVNGVKVSDEENEYWYYIVSGPSMSYCQDAVIYDMSTSSGEQLKWNDRSASPRAMWKFVKATAGGSALKVVNKATGRYMRNTGELSTKVTSQDQAAQGTGFSLNSLGEQRAFLIREGTKNPVHADKIGVIVAWRTVNLNSASVWHFDPVSDNDLNAATDDATGYELVWADEFDTDGRLNEDNWSYERGFVRNSEPQWYQPDNAICKDGNLVITARIDTVANPNYKPSSSSWKENRQYAYYTSSSVITAHKQDLLYGRMEIRAKIPTTSGAWPAIWCKGYPETNGSWPACGEVDILEFYSKSILANVAWSNAAGASQWRTVKTPFTHFTDKDPNWSDKYHIWRMDWDSLSIRLYLDDELLNVTSLARTVQPVGSFCKVENPFKTPMFLLLNLALKDGDGIDKTAFPLTYYIDYVRFYKPRTQPDAIHDATATAERPFVTMVNGTPCIDLCAFNGEVSVSMTDMMGRIVSRFQVEAAHGTIVLPTMEKGAYVVKATDGHTTLSAKVLQR